MENYQNSLAAYIKKDGNIGFNLAVYNRFSSIGDSFYSEICGGFIEGVYQWATHNIDSVIESKNSKYFGWSITFQSGAVRRVYIPVWVMNVKPKDWKHAKSLFNKYLLEDSKFNTSAQANKYQYC